MRKEEQQRRYEAQLRSRDPKAHAAMILRQRESDLQQIQQQVPPRGLLSAAILHPMAQNEGIRWDAPLIATRDMLCPPSTAPDATLGARIMPHTPYTPLVASPSIVASSNMDPPVPRPLSSSSLETGRDASTSAPKQIQTSVVIPQRPKGTDKLTTHDLQNEVDESITYLSKYQATELEEALGEAIGDLFGKELLNENLVGKKLVPRALRKATREEFQAILSRKCLDTADSLRLSYARELRGYVFRKAKTQEEYGRLVSGLKLLLDKESISPKILLKVLGDKLRPVKPDAPPDIVVGRQDQPDRETSGHPDRVQGETESTVPTSEDQSGHQRAGSGPTNGINGHKAEMNGARNQSKEKKRGRKRSVSADEEQRKKAKHVPAPAPNIHSSETMENTFEKLLSREAARSSRGRSRS